MADSALSCGQCGAQLPTPSGRGRRRKYCSYECGQEWHRLRRLAEDRANGVRPDAIARAERSAASPINQDHTCQGCGKTFRPKRSDRRKYCSRQCAFAHQKQWQRKPKPKLQVSKVWFMVCTECSAPFASQRRGVKVCSAACRKERARRHEAERKQCDARPCRECRRRFSPEYGNKRRIFCSKLCATKHGRKAHRQKYGTNHRKRARHYGVEYEPVNIHLIFERDRWRCQVCGRKTPERLRGTIKSNAPEIDHRIPMAMGGGHTYTNVQCACRECNIAKAGDKVVGKIPLFIR